MKPKTLIVAAGAACLLVLLTPRVISQDQEAEARLARHQARVLAEAGPEHWLLARLAGDWAVETTFHGTGAEEPPRVAGEGTGELVAGERFLVLKLLIGTEPRTSERVTLLGFDRRAGEYTAVQADSHGTHYIEARGRYDAEEGVIVLEGEDADPQLGTTARFRFVLRLEESGFGYDVLGLPVEGEPVLLMESRFRPLE